MLRILEDLHRNAVAFPTAPALVSVGHSAREATNYRQLDDQVGRIAAAIRARVPGGVVLLCYPNRPQFVSAFLGILAAERMLFPLAADLAAPELAAAARRSSAAAAIVAGDFAAAFNGVFKSAVPFPEAADDVLLLTEPDWRALPATAPALLLHSSGTTAQPKVVMRDGPALDAVSKNMVRACGFRHEDHILAAVPLCHSYGLEHGILAPISAGCCVHVCRKFDLAAVLAELRESGITVFPGVPFMFEMLGQSGGGEFPSFRLAYSAGGPLPRATFDRFHRNFGLKLGQVYGATEVGSVTFNDPSSARFDPSSVGLPMDGVSIRLLDPDSPRICKGISAPSEGEIAVAAPSMFSSYLGDENSGLVDGHFRTGDLGTLDTLGNLTITGRLKLLIDIGGRKVNPAEVESVLREHPRVGQCVVVPIRLSETVQRLKAVVTPGRPDLELSPQDLRRFVRQRLSAYKVPRIFEIRDALPTSSAGKVLRRLAEAP